MSRHRNVRTMNYDDEYDDDDDYQYGHSVEDDCISPTDAQQWMYDRAKGQQSMSAFLANNRDIEEEDDDGLEADRSGTSGAHKRRDSECYQLPELNDEDRVRLNSCMDEIRNIVGESVTDRQLVEAIMKHGYNFDLALDDVLNSTKTPPTASVTSPVVVAKPLQSTIEKDSKLPQLFPSIGGKGGPPNFALPNVRFGAGGGVGTNLSDLVKSRMKKSGGDGESGNDSDKSDDVDETVPTMANLSLSNDSGVASSSPLEGTFSNLADLAKFHLQSKGGTPIGSPLASKAGTFAIPSLFNTPTNHPLTLASAALANSQPTPLSKKEWIVDLKSALIKDKSEISSRSAATANPSTKSNSDAENESPPEQQQQQQYGFIDCDIPDEEDPAQKPIFDEFCSIDASSIALQILPNVTSVSSGLATVLCRRYRKRTTVRVRHGFVTKPVVAIVQKIVPFRFHVPSPDDIILRHLKKFRR